MNEITLSKTYPFVTSYFYISNFLTEEENKILTEDIIYHRKNDPEGVDKSNDGGWQSKDFTEFSENHKFLQEKLDHVLLKVFEDYQLKLKPKVFNYWINVNNRGSYNITHVHPNSMFSVVLYIKKPKDSGNIVFQRPDNLELFMPPSSESFDRNASWIPEVSDRDLIVFPSHIPHFVMQSKTDDDRITMAFNYKGV